MFLKRCLETSNFEVEKLSRGCLRSSFFGSWRVWGHLGRDLGDLGGILGVIWGALGWFWEPLEVILGVLRVILGAPRVSLDPQVDFEEKSDLNPVVSKSARTFWWRLGGCWTSFWEQFWMIFRSSFFWWKIMIFWESQYYVDESIIFEGQGSIWRGPGAARMRQNRSWNVEKNNHNK